jgi:hypothetical protein
VDVIRPIERHFRDRSAESAKVMCWVAACISPIPLSMGSRTRSLPSIRRQKLASLPTYLSRCAGSEVLDGCNRQRDYGRAAASGRRRDHRKDQSRPVRDGTISTALQASNDLCLNDCSAPFNSLVAVAFYDSARSSAGRPGENAADQPLRRASPCRCGARASGRTGGGFGITALENVVIDQPEAAREKSAFAGRQAIGGILSFVAKDEFAIDRQAVLNCPQRSLEPWIGGGGGRPGASAAGSRRGHLEWACTKLLSSRSKPR